jgi:hypothetical protein
VRQQRAALLRAGRRRSARPAPATPRPRRAPSPGRTPDGCSRRSRGCRTARAAGADAAGVEADPVVGVARVLGHAAAEQGERAPRAARPARVDQHRALRLGVGDLVLHPRHRDLDLAPPGCA